MKVMHASRTFYEYPQFEETEFALAIAPSRQIEGSKNIGENTEFARNRSRPDPRDQAQRSRQAVLDDQELTEALTIGWAIVLAIAVALAVYASGG